MQIAAPMSLGVTHLAPLLPALLAALPLVTVDLHLSDARVDLVADGFDFADDGGLVAGVRRICAVRRMLVEAPAYFAMHGHPAHSADLAGHRCLSYAYLPTADRWRFEHASGEVVTVTPAGAGRGGVGVQPELIGWRDLAEGRLERTMPDWAMAEIALNLVIPPGGLRPRRGTAVMVFWRRGWRRRRGR